MSQEGMKEWKGKQPTNLQVLNFQAQQQQQKNRIKLSSMLKHCELSNEMKLSSCATCYACVRLFVGKSSFRVTVLHLDGGWFFFLLVVEIIILKVFNQQRKKHRIAV